MLIKYISDSLTYHEQIYVIGVQMLAKEIILIRQLSLVRPKKLPKVHQTTLRINFH